MTFCIGRDYFRELMLEIEILRGEVAGMQKEMDKISREVDKLNTEVDKLLDTCAKWEKQDERMMQGINNIFGYDASIARKAAHGQEE